MFRTKWLAGMTLGLVLLISLIGGASVLAQEKSVELHLAPIHDSGVSGMATLTDVKGGVKVELKMKGLPEAGVEHINHIHAGGTCTEVAAGKMPPVTIPLNPIVAKGDGTGSATTTVKDVTLSQLFNQNKERVVLVHAKVKKGQGVPPAISCADLVLPAIKGKELPNSGGIQPAAVLLSAGVLLLALSVTSRFILRHNRQVRS